MTRDDVIDIYDRLIASHAEITRKGKSTAYTALAGNMFSFVGPDSEMCLRLAPDDIAAFGQVHDAAPVLRHNSVMRGYVAVPKSLLQDEAELAQWFAHAVTFARGLKPKPTTRKK